MSRDSIENTEDNSQVELSSKEHDIPNLSKSMCYPHLFKVNSKAIIHGHRNEAPAVDAYM